MLDYELNNKIIKLAPKFIAKDIAPSTFNELKAIESSHMVVYSGESDNTIYGNPSVNHAFRAWHDALHIKLNVPFTLQGETIVALEQCRLIQSDYHAKLIMAEVVGQVVYFDKYKRFPDNQIEFAKSFLKVG